MSVFTDSKEIAILREGGQRLARIMEKVEAAVRPGITTKELDQLAYRLIKEGGDEPAFLNYTPAGALRPYPASLCVSVNDEVVHGIPGSRVLKEGDIVGLDLGLNHRGFFTDMAVTVGVGKISPDLTRLIDLTKLALDQAVGKVRAGARIGLIGEIIEKIAKKENLGLVTELGGHGLGRKPHDDLHIPNFGKKTEGPRLRQGEVIAIEPMFTLASGEVLFEADGYTVKTRDRSPAAHFEHTVIVTEGGREVLTK